MSKQISAKVNRAAASARLVNRNTGQQAVSMYELDRNRVLMQFCFVKVMSQFCVMQQAVLHYTWETLLLFQV